MQAGARNKIMGSVSRITKGDVMTLIKVDVQITAEMGSVITTESAEEMGLKEGDQVELIIKAIHVLPVKID